MNQQLKDGPVPEHVAIIMDGNGRWAKERGLNRSDGHKQGVETIREIAIAANNIGVKALTVYAFSTENWKRPISEVNYLMKLPEVFFDRFLPELIDNNIQIQLIGFEERVPFMTKQILKKAVNQTKHCTGMKLNFAFNYGGRAEIVSAVKQIANKVKTGELAVESIDDEIIRQHLLTSPLIPYDDVDFLIRTSNEKRLSNYLLWQNAYSEFYFTDVYWPDFSQQMFYKAIEEYQNRNRRFGGINDSKETE